MMSGLLTGISRLLMELRRLLTRERKGKRISEK